MIENGKIKYTFIEATANIGRREPEAAKRPIYNDWEAFTEGQRKLAPVGMKDFEQTSGSWTFMVSELAFVSSAIQGCLISLVFAFVVLLIAT